MTDFIPREAAFNAVLKLVPKVDDDGYCWVIRGDAATAIDSIPAADVRPVVTCGECKHWETDWTPRGVSDGRHYCLPLDAYPSADWFCADGAKREES